MIDLRLITEQLGKDARQYAIEHAQGGGLTREHVQELLVGAFISGAIAGVNACQEALVASGEVSTNAVS